MEVYIFNNSIISPNYSINVGQVQLKIYKLWSCGGRKVILGGENSPNESLVQTRLKNIYNFVIERSIIFVIIVF